MKMSFDMKIIQKSDSTDVRGIDVRDFDVRGVDELSVDEQDAEKNKMLREGQDAEGGTRC
jgi:hypothetical protein